VGAWQASLVGAIQERVRQHQGQQTVGTGDAITFQLTVGADGTPRWPNQNLRNPALGNLAIAAIRELVQDQGATLWRPPDGQPHSLRVPISAVPPGVLTGRATATGETPPGGPALPPLVAALPGQPVTLRGKTYRWLDEQVPGGRAVARQTVTTEITAQGKAFTSDVELRVPVSAISALAGGPLDVIVPLEPTGTGAHRADRFVGQIYRATDQRVWAAGTLWNGEAPLEVVRKKTRQAVAFAAPLSW
jgi:hypothetical protein